VKHLVETSCPSCHTAFRVEVPPLICGKGSTISAELQEISEMLSSWTVSSDIERGRQRLRVVCSALERASEDLDFNREYLEKHHALNGVQR